MKVFFIGYLVPWDLCYQLNAASVAGNKMQMNIVDNLRKLNAEVKIFTIIPIAQYPKSKHIFINNKKNYRKNEEIKYIPFINIPIIKQLSIIINLFVILLINILKENERPTILVYNNFSPLTLPILFLKRFLKVESFCIVADLPHTLYKFNKPIKKYLEKLDFKFQINSLKKYNGLFPVTKYIRLDYAPEVPFLTIEGGINMHDFENCVSNVEISIKEGSKTIMYSGFLDDINGIELLIQSFIKIKNENVNLLIFGRGPLEKYILEQSKIDERIKFMGFQKNNVILEYQKRCDFLIIPRPIKQTITKYTFPSKLFEYMMSAKPIICTDLICLTDEYREVLFITKDDTIKGFSNFINYVINLDEKILFEKGIKAKEFLINNKTWATQALKMKKFMESYKIF